MEIKPEQLRKKGWTEKEINHATHILDKVKRNKHPHHNVLNEATFWSMLALSIFAMVAITYWITPLFVYSKNIILFPLLIIIGVTFGFLFQIIIKDLDHLQIHHHTILIITIPLAGILSGIAILGKITQPELIGGIKHNPYVTSIIFIVSFLAPYVYYVIKKK